MAEELSEVNPSGLEGADATSTVSPSTRTVAPTRVVAFNTPESLQSPEQAEDIEPIWRLPSFQPGQFFAAAHFIVSKKMQQTQMFIPRPRPEAEINPLEKKLLDSMSLLFARFKKNYDDSEKTTGPQNVTSAALQNLALAEKKYVIWVAKNDGPQTIFGISDTEVAKELQKWFNDEGKTDDDELLDYLKKLWVAREESCRTKMTECHKLMREAIGPNDHENLLTQYRQLARVKTTTRISFDEAIFEDDWALIQSFVASGASESPKPPIKHQEYPRFKIKDEGTSAAQKGMEYFRRLVKHARIFHTPHSAIRHFKDWRDEIRKEQEDIEIEIELLPQPKSFAPLEKEKLKQAAESWIPALDKPDSAFIKDRNEFVQELSTLRTGKRYFHCELQLLEKFLVDPNVCYYIGGSKDSCFMCWSVLARSGTDYTTRGSHSVLYADCAFPFSIQNSKSYSQLVMAVKGIQDHVLGRVLRYAVDDDAAFTSYDTRTETNPADASDAAFEDRYLGYADLPGFPVVTESDLHNQTDSSVGLGEYPESKIVKFIKIPKKGSDPELVDMRVLNISESYDHQRHHHHERLIKRGDAWWITKLQLDTEGPNHGDKGYWTVVLVDTSKPQRQDIDSQHVQMLLRMYSAEGLCERNEWFEKEVKRSPNSPAASSVEEPDFLWRDDIYLFKVNNLVSDTYEFEDMDQREIGVFSKACLKAIGPYFYDDLLRHFGDSKT